MEQWLTEAVKDTEAVGERETVTLGVKEGESVGERDCVRLVLNVALAPPAGGGGALGELVVQRLPEPVTDTEAVGERDLVTEAVKDTEVVGERDLVTLAVKEEVREAAEDLVNLAVAVPVVETETQRLIEGGGVPLIVVLLHELTDGEGESVEETLVVRVLVALSHELTDEEREAELVKLLLGVPLLEEVLLELRVTLALLDAVEENDRVGVFLDVALWLRDARRVAVTLPLFELVTLALLLSL